MAPRAPYPLYTTSYTLHRLSPLFLGQTLLDHAQLQQYGRRLRELIRGEVLRGVRVGLGPEDDALARVGALKGVDWYFLPFEDDWDESEELEMRAATLESSCGIVVQITYDKASFRAILLKSDAPRRPGFATYPLLLTRMPASLRSTFTSFLETTFDTRASTLKLPSSFIADALEKYLAEVSQDGTDLKSAIRDLLVTLGFPQSGLKTIDVLVDRDDVRLMIRRGHKLEQVRTRRDQPFLTSLAHYIHGHTAINLDHELVSIVKVACGAFVLGTEGKMKLFAPPDEDGRQALATKNLVVDLLEYARGTLGPG